MLLTTPSLLSMDHWVSAFRSEYLTRVDMASEYGESFDKYQAGRLEMEKCNYDGAIALFEESVRIAPHFKTLELLGECKLNLRRPSEAIVPLAAAVTLGTNEFRAMYLLARALSEVGEKRDALKFLEVLLQREPTFKSARELRDSLNR